MSEDTGNFQLFILVNRLSPGYPSARGSGSVSNIRESTPVGGRRMFAEGAADDD